MHWTIRSTWASAIAVCLGVFAGDCVAAAQRTFVASTGNDANACSLAFPCRSFAAAIAQTLSGGEVIVVDSAGYGPVTITQPVSIVAPPGIYAGISVSGASGIAVIAGSGKVTLSGLAVNSIGSSVGIDYQSGSELYVDRMTVTNFPSVGLRASVAADSALFISNSVFRDNGTFGVSLTATSGVLTASIEESAFENNGNGLSVIDNVVGAVRTSIFTGNDYGVVIGPLSGGKTDNVELSECTMRGNTTAGVALGSVSFAAATARIVSSLIAGNSYGILVQMNSTYSAYVSDSTITHNATGLGLFGGATIVSGGDNRLVDNTANGAFSSTVPKL